MTLRRARLLDGLDLAHSIGAEIGALDKPLVTRSDGTVIYIDHSDAATLRQRYATHANVDVSRIEVDVVWGTKTLRQAARHSLGERFPNSGLDYVVASHVIEHVPDFIGWLHEVREVLKPGGALRLAVPDRRYSLDIRRRETVLVDVLAAWVQQDRRPNVHCLLDFCLHEATVDAEDAWADRLDADALKRGPTHTLHTALLVARDALYNGSYHDVHCWVFTPRTFALLCAELAGHGLVGYACERFHDTERNANELIVALRASDERAANVASWQAMADTVAR